MSAFDARQSTATSDPTAERTNRLLAATASLSEALTAVQVTQVIVHHGILALGAQAGVVGVVDETGTYVETPCAVGYPPHIVRQFHCTSLDQPLPLNDVVRTQQPLFLGSLQQRHELYPHLQNEREAIGGKAMAAAPLSIGSKRFGAIVFHFADERHFSPEDRTFVLTLARLCAQALDRARLYEAEHVARTKAEAERHRAAFLAEASATLATRLDYPDVLETVVQTVVPRVADWCAVDVAKGDILNGESALAHGDARLAQRIHELRQQAPLHIDQQGALTHVFRRGHAALYAQDIAAGGEASIAGCSTHGDCLRQLGLQSLMVVPMHARNRPLGVLTFGIATGRPRFGPDDLEMAKQLAQRTATAIENATLYRELRESEQLRHTVLMAIPDMLFRISRAGVLTDFKPGLGIEPFLPPPVFLGKHLRDVMHESAAAAYMVAVDKAFATGEVQVAEYVLQRDDVPHHFEARIAVHREDSVVAIVRDVTARKRSEELRKRFLDQVISAQEEERRRVAREFHDTIGQSLTSILLGLRALEGHADATGKQRIAQLRALSSSTLEEAQRLARGLRPSALDDLGFAAAVERHVHDCRKAYGLNIDLHIADFDGGTCVDDSQRRLPTAHETALYRIVQEALTNVARHARATNVSVVIERHPTFVRAIIEDDGRGFRHDTHALSMQNHGSGLVGIKERAALLDGRVVIESSPDQGTALYVTLPLEPPSSQPDSKS